jgi:hypothetical protein
MIIKSSRSKPFCDTQKICSYSFQTGASCVQGVAWYHVCCFATWRLLVVCYVRGRTLAWRWLDLVLSFWSFFFLLVCLFLLER